MRDQVMALLQRHLEGPFKHSGDKYVQTRCPFHKDGQERKPSFSINVEEAFFHCFTCHIAGDLRELLKLLGLPKEKIEVEINPLVPLLEEIRERRQLQKEHTFQKNDPFEAKVILPEVILGIYDWEPEPLLRAGFDAGLLKEMEVGFDKSLRRITYPLRDIYGNLAGISGGATDASQNPKYLVYQGGRKNHKNMWIPGDFGSWFDSQFPSFVCENHGLLWNAHRVFPKIQGTGETLYIVEGFKACLWMIQSGFPNTVALMGSSISERQQQLLHRLGCPVVLVLDNDEAGRTGAIRIGQQLFKSMYGHIGVAQYPEEDNNTQPDSYTREQLNFIVKDAKPFIKHRLSLLKSNPRLLRSMSKWQ